MHKFRDNKFSKDIVSIGPGEYFISDDENIIIQTVLGSCIAVCLFTDYDKFSGMNHFMLPGTTCSNNIYDCDSGRYGMYAMELLINSLLKKGLNRKHLKAKVFGGGNVLDMKSTKKTVGENNVIFINNYLERENIPIVSEHTGGDYARKVLFFIDTKKVLLKKIDKSETFKTIREEIEYQHKIENETKTKSNIILF